MAKPRPVRRPQRAPILHAGYNKDFITAQGILDAFRDAELCAKALDESFSGARPFEDVMGEYQRTRDAQVGAMYEFTCELATLEPPPPELQHLLRAVHGNQAAMDGFVRLNAGTISPTEFFAPENIEAIFASTERYAIFGSCRWLASMHCSFVCWMFIAVPTFIWEKFRNVDPISLQRSPGKYVPYFVRVNSPRS